ncbi:hypothetical protein KRX19_09485 [Cardiobacteriaceae bacterium TAE3-ERU3]|nr:hypothetical protein [Cardiobacteriaceae bacterium TAE3-ERU3]
MKVAAIMLSAAIVLSACNEDTKKSEQTAETEATSSQTQATPAAAKPDAKPEAQAGLPFNESIISYYRAKQDDELAACRGSHIKPQSDNPDADCYDKLDAAFIEPRILYQNDHVALLSTKNMFGMGSADEYSAELISLEKDNTVPLWGALGSDFNVSETGNNELNIHYKTTEYSKPVEKNAQIQY